MKNILNFDIQNNGIMSGLPFLCSYLSSVVFCYIADGLLKYKLLSLTNVRKLMTASSQVIPGLLVVLVGYMGDELVWILIVWSLAVMLASIYEISIVCLMYHQICSHYLSLLNRLLPATVCNNTICNIILLYSHICYTLIFVIHKKYLNLKSIELVLRSQNTLFSNSLLLNNTFSSFLTSALVERSETLSARELNICDNLLRTGQPPTLSFNFN